jgi:hypothetical protein
MMKLSASSTRMKRKERTTTSDLLFGTDLLLFPFWCLDAKEREESIYLAISVMFIVFIWIWLVRL